MVKKDMERKLRADAKLNRQRLLDIATVTFAEKGVSASLEEIARIAGVGIGTLYRHFPTRDVLINEMYQHEGSRLAKAAERLSKELPPVDAVRKWLLLFIKYLSNKQIMVEVLNCMTGDSDRLSGAKLIGALETLLERAHKNGDIDLKAESLDILCAIAGVASFCPDADWEIRAKRLVDVMVAGLQSDSK